MILGTLRNIQSLQMSYGPWYPSPQPSSSAIQYSILDDGVSYWILNCGWLCQMMVQISLVSPYVETVSDHIMCRNSFCLMIVTCFCFLSFHSFWRQWQHLPSVASSSQSVWRNVWKTGTLWLVLPFSLCRRWYLLRILGAFTLFVCCSVET